MILSSRKERTRGLVRRGVSHTFTSSHIEERRNRKGMGRWTDWKECEWPMAVCTLSKREKTSEQRREKKRSRREEEKRGVVGISNQQREGLSSIPACMIRYGTDHEIPSVNYLPVLLRYRFVGILLPKVSDGDVPFMLRYWYGSARVIWKHLDQSASLLLFFTSSFSSYCTLYYCYDHYDHYGVLCTDPGTTGRWSMRWYSYYRYDSSDAWNRGAFFLTSLDYCWLLLLHESHRAACSTALESVSFWPRLSSIQLKSFKDFTCPLAQQSICQIKTRREGSWGRRGLASVQYYY